MKLLSPRRVKSTAVFRSGQRLFMYVAGKCPSRLTGELFRFLLAGVAATAADFSVLVLLTSLLDWHYLSANTVSFLVGNVVSYLFSIYWVFETRRLKNQVREFVIFALIGIGGLGISQLTMLLSVELLGLHFTLAKLVSVGATFIWNFGVKKIVLFNKCRSAAASQRLKME